MVRFFDNMTCKLSKTYFVELTCPNLAAVYANVFCISDMDSIGVRTIRWCCYYQIEDFYKHTFLKRQMHFLCISEPQIGYLQIFALIESHSLKCDKKTEVKKQI